MSIWFDKSVTPPGITMLAEDTMSHYLGLECIEVGDDFLRLRMPVTEKTRQPYGLLHGGASCVLAETAGSLSSALVIDQQLYKCVGIEINANHIRSVSEGYVTGICKPLHLGKRTHVWDIKIFDDNDRLVCVSRLTVAILESK